MLSKLQYVDNDLCYNGHGNMCRKLGLYMSTIIIISETKVNQ